jgi:hypothetical protein
MVEFWAHAKIGVRKAVKLADNIVRGIANGVTLNLADHLAAKMNEKLGRGGYEENLREEIARDSAAGVEYAAGYILGASVALKDAGEAAFALRKLRYEMPKMLEGSLKTTLTNQMESAFGELSKEASTHELAHLASNIEIHNLRKELTNEASIFTSESVRRMTARISPVVDAAEGVTNGLVAGGAGASAKNVAEHVDQVMDPNRQSTAIPRNSGKIGR